MEGRGGRGGRGRGAGPPNNESPASSAPDTDAALRALHAYVVAQGGEISSASGISGFYKQAGDNSSAFKEALHSLGARRIIILTEPVDSLFSSGQLASKSMGNVMVCSVLEQNGSRNAANPLCLVVFLPKAVIPMDNR